MKKETKKSKQEKPKWLGDMKVEIKQDLDLKDILHTALSKYTVKDLLEYMFVVTSFDGLMHGYSMLAFLATEKDVEDVKSMVFLKYVLDNWDKKEFLKKAGKHFGEVMKKVEKRAKEDEKSKRKKDENSKNNG